MTINKMRDHHQGYNSLLSRSVERGLEVPLPPPLHLSRNKYILFAHWCCTPRYLYRNHPYTTISQIIAHVSHVTNILSDFAQYLLIHRCCTPSCLSYLILHFPNISCNQLSTSTFKQHRW